MASVAEMGGDGKLESMLEGMSLSSIDKPKCIEDLRVQGLTGMRMLAMCASVGAADQFLSEVFGGEMLLGNDAVSHPAAPLYCSHQKWLPSLSPARSSSSPSYSPMAASPVADDSPAVTRDSAVKVPIQDFVPSLGACKLQEHMRVILRCDATTLAVQDG